MAGNSKFSYAETLLEFCWFSGGTLGLLKQFAAEAIFTIAASNFVYVCYTTTHKHKRNFRSFLLSRPLD